MNVFPLISCLVALGVKAAAQQEMGRMIQYTGICDASAAVALNRGLFIVADDEDNTLRVYRRYEGGPPVYSLDLSNFLRLAPKSPETDIEAAAPLEDLTFWITSHGRNSKGKNQPNRQRLFATRSSVVNGEVQIKPVGVPYTRLLRDLIGHPSLRPFRLAEAAAKAPKLPGALNIEGLTANDQGHLLIGFRNPIPDGKALVVPLLNPKDVINGKTAALGESFLLDLDGLGIRSMAFGKDGYLIIAGSFNTEGESRLYQWDGKPGSKPVWLKGAKFPGLNPEALTFSDNQKEIEIFSDDGTVSVGGEECKKVKDWRMKHFRATWLIPGDERL